MNGLSWFLFGLTVLLDVFGQTSFKVGLARIEDGAAGAVFAGRLFLGFLDPKTWGVPTARRPKGLRSAEAGS